MSWDSLYYLQFGRLGCGGLGVEVFDPGQYDNACQAELMVYLMPKTCAFQHGTFSLLYPYKNTQSLFRVITTVCHVI